VKPLHCIHPTAQTASKEADPGYSAQVGFGLAGDRLRARFVVRCPELNVDPEVPDNAPHWGLWERDVVELFIGFPHKPYFEFQVSPLGQYFELKVLEPRMQWQRDLPGAWSRGARIISAPEAAPGSPHQGAHWEAWMEIPLRPLGWGGDLEQLRGGAFAILGAASRRTYWSLFLPPQEKPDFHIPESFGRLIPGHHPGT
jgi:hypothetical protein